MSVLSPNELKSLCETYHLTPSKKYGQNYLISSAPIEKMIVAAELSPDDTVVEIGPGFGILTFSLAPLVKKIIAFEIEKKLMPYWSRFSFEENRGSSISRHSEIGREKITQYKNIEIVWGNALQEMQNLEFRIKNYKVIANIPYQITSHLLRTLLELKNKPERIIIMAQKEVAERICAKPGDMSMLAVSVQYYGEPKIIAKVSKGNFWPSPQVDSAVLCIKISRQARDPELASGFFKVVKAGFTNKRKQLWRNLASHLGLEKEVVKSAIKDAVGNEKIRAEDLSIAEWIKITELIHGLR